MFELPFKQHEHDEQLCLKQSNCAVAYNKDNLMLYMLHCINLPCAVKRLLQPLMSAPSSAAWVTVQQSALPLPQTGCSINQGMHSFPLLPCAVAIYQDGDKIWPPGYLTRQSLYQIVFCATSNFGELSRSDRMDMSLVLPRASVDWGTYISEMRTRHMLHETPRLLSSTTWCTQLCEEKEKVYSDHFIQIFISLQHCTMYKYISFKFKTQQQCRKSCLLKV